MEIPDPIKQEVNEKGGLKGIDSKTPSMDVLEAESRVHKALSDPGRLRILHMLSVQHLCVCCIKELVDMSDSKLSYHLNQLKEAGLIAGEQSKNWIIYRPTAKGYQMIGKEVEE